VLHFVRIISVLPQSGHLVYYKCLYERAETALLLGITK